MIPISYLNTYIYCKRRFYYEFVLGEEKINFHVLQGTIKHNKVHKKSKTSNREIIHNKRVFLYSEKLGISGYSDLIEETPDKIYPVEYKKGKIGDWINDQIQLCAQALVLEEKLKIKIDFGFIYYFTSNKRKKVFFTEELRNKTIETIKEINELLLNSEIPKAQYSRRCVGCSIKTICLPEEVNYVNSLFD